MNILALTFGDENTASSHYRIYQYRKPLFDLGIRLNIEPAKRFCRWTQLSEYDAVVIQKKLLRSRRLHLVRRQAPRLIYDTDDAVWEPHSRSHHWLTRWRTRWRLRRAASLADCCWAANEVLASELRRYSKRVEVVPMALDETIWFPKRERGVETLRIGWAGAPVNLPYFTTLEPALLAVQQAHPKVEIVVYCGQAPPLDLGLKVTFIAHKQGSEPDVVRSFDIGLLPLPNGAFASAKSPIKGLQYMACGVPTVASPRTGTRELFQDDQTALYAEHQADWVTALLRLAGQPELREQLRQHGRERFSARHTRSCVSSLLAERLRSLRD